jgi:hypothetical protein
MASPQATRMVRGASLFSRLPVTGLRLRSALASLPPPAARPRVAWLSGAYVRRGPGGDLRDALFGDLTAELTPHAEQVWLHPPLIAAGADGIHAEPVYRLATDFANQLSSLQRFRPAVRTAAAALARKLAALTPTVAGLSWHSACLDALAMFEARRIAWRMVFARVEPAVVLLTNAPYMAGEVAAAKSCGAHVVEFQHGLFGPRCPEYGWPAALSSKRDRMAVVDRLFVSGDLFRGGALKNAFWRSDDVRVIGSAEIEHLRREPARRRRRRSAHRVFDAADDARGGRGVLGSFPGRRRVRRVSPRVADHQGAPVGASRGGRLSRAGAASSGTLHRRRGRR